MLALWGGPYEKGLPKMRQRKENNKKYVEDAEKTRTEVTGGHLHTMFTSLGEEPLGADFIKLGEDDEFK